jgi:hypothetical protein
VGEDVDRLFFWPVARSMIASPWRPMDSLSATSSSAMSRASAHAVPARCEAGWGATSRSMRSSAQARFTAVGRVLRRASKARFSDLSVGSSNMASARPNAAATPISGAPRTRIVRIASAISAIFPIVRVSKTCGSRDWSMMCTTPGVESAQMLR